jgi:hypothetical protein
MVLAVAQWIHISEQSKSVSTCCSRSYRRCWNAAGWVWSRRFIGETRRHPRDRAGTIT